jgi:peptidoglycan/LPS O-acetylase OafA/YrhL
MILTAIASFTLAVVLGLALVVLGLRKQRGSLPLALAHASFAVLGLSLLLWQTINSPTQKLYNLAALLFVLALLGGLVLLALRVSKREYRTRPPLFAVILHAVMGVFALLLLVVGVNHL